MNINEDVILILNRIDEFGESLSIQKKDISSVRYWLYEYLYYKRPILYKCKFILLSDKKLRGTKYSLVVTEELDNSESYWKEIKKIARKQNVKEAEDNYMTLKDELINYTTSDLEKMEFDDKILEFLAYNNIDALPFRSGEEVVKLRKDIFENIINWKGTELFDSSLNLLTGGKYMIKILFLAAIPTNFEVRLRVDEESREIEEKLNMAKMREQFQVESKMAVRPEDLTQALLNIEPRIVHFSGHGSESGKIYLEDKVGQAHPVGSDALTNLFKLVANHVECVILNACYTKNQANAIAKHIQYVIGMDHAISDKAAIAFSVGFYQALGSGKSVEEAYKFGVAQIGLQVKNFQEHLTPVLIKRINHEAAHGSVK